jgi:hypothetical protein
MSQQNVVQADGAEINSMLVKVLVTSIKALMQNHTMTYLLLADYCTLGLPLNEADLSVLKSHGLADENGVFNQVVVLFKNCFNLDTGDFVAP